MWGALTKSPRGGLVVVLLLTRNKILVQMCLFSAVFLPTFSPFSQNGFLNFWGWGGGHVRQDRGLGGHGRHLGPLGAEVAGVSRLYPREDCTPRIHQPDQGLLGLWAGVACDP